MKKILSLVLAIVLMMGLFTGCAPKEAPVDGAEENVDRKKVALLCDKAGTQIFVLSMIDGLNEAAEKYDFEAIVAESGDAAAFEDNASALIEEGVDLIIGGGWLAGDAINKVALEFPDEASYALIDSEVEAANVKCISYREQEGAYLIGLIATMVADEDEDFFSAIHVNQGPGSWKWRYGYMEAIKSVKPDAKFAFNYVGNYNDPAKAKEFAIQQFAQGASFINSAAAGGDNGVFEAALEKGFYTSGQDVDLTTPDNEFIVSSQIKDTNSTIQNILDNYFSSDWSSENETWGITEGTIGAVHVTHESVNPRSERLSDEEVATLKKAAEDIANGTIDLVEIPDEESYK